MVKELTYKTALKLKGLGFKTFVLRKITESEAKAIVKYWKHIIEVVEEEE